MEKRVLGKTGERLSVLGFGGIVVSNVSDAEASSYVARAIDEGINYFDVAPTYGDAEERLGPALSPYRDQVFLACKTVQRAAKDAEMELQRSLKRLKTDHVDLYQLHGVASMADVDTILAPGGALETFVAAREKGMARYLGFSVHSEECALRLLEAFPFDSVLMPVNLFCWRDGGFGSQVCEQAQAQGTGILALKALAKRPHAKGQPKKWPKCWYDPIDTLADAEAALAFTLSKPVTAALPPGHAELLWLACEAVKALEASPGDVPSADAIEGEPIFSTLH